MEHPVGRAFIYSHSPISFYFSHTPRDFVVQEIPLYEFSGNGEHRILQLRKKNLTTFELINILKDAFGCASFEIGYAGLKDKSATTTQFVSIPKKYIKNPESSFSSLHPQIKLISHTLHNNKLKLGHLKGNNFFVRLKRVNQVDSVKLANVIDKITKNGFGNFFGFQRFGINGDNYLLGKDLAHKTKMMRDRKKRDFLISSYQSYLFNSWLNKRIILSIYLNSLSTNEAKVALSKSNLKLDSSEIKALQAQPQLFKLFSGDLCCHYPYGKFFTLESKINDLDITRFCEARFSPTGALSSKSLKMSQNLAFEVEKDFLDSKLLCVGSRRYAWVWAENVEYCYKPEDAHFELNFSLPKGAYATTFLEEIAHKKLEIKKEDDEF